MPELRWTLLIIGALFVVGLALWEFRRQRQVPRQGANPRTPTGSERVTPTLDGSEGARVHREPTITLPELQPDSRGEPRLSGRAREPAQDPPVVEVDDASFSRLRVEGESGEPAAMSDDAPELTAPDADASTAQLAPKIAAPKPASTLHSSVAPPGDTPTGFVSDVDEPEAPPQARPHSAETAASRESHPAGASAAGAPIVDWPEEQGRKIVALRLVSAPASRFQGRAVRQALAAEGFVLGKFDIFHKPGPDDRAVLSAASLTKPGTFALNTIDAQRFGGISLFAVLPGPLPAQQTFDELLNTARSLNERLQGALQDERGEPLTPMRSATIRQSLSEGDGSAGASFAPQSETRQ
jgi:cell division protein ZipA